LRHGVHQHVLVLMYYAYCYLHYVDILLTNTWMDGTVQRQKMCCYFFIVLM